MNAAVAYRGGGLGDRAAMILNPVIFPTINGGGGIQLSHVGALLAQKIFTAVKGGFVAADVIYRERALPFHQPRDRETFASATVFVMEYGVTTISLSVTKPHVDRRLVGCLRRGVNSRLGCL